MTRPSRDRPTAQQIGRIDDLAADAGLDNVGLYAVIREVTGVPSSQPQRLNPTQADAVIYALETNTLAPQLPIPQVPSDRVEPLITGCEVTES